MAIIKKVKLPDGTTHDVNDARITGIDNTPVQNSTNVVTSGGLYTELIDVVHQGDTIGSTTYEDSGTVVDLTDYVREDNLKTVNNQSLLGSGNITISGGSEGITIYDVEDAGSTTAGTWLGSCPAITAYTDGLTIRYKLHVAGASTTTLNINGLGAKTVYRVSSTKLTTHYPVNSYIILYYAANLNNGSWEVYTDYDANTNTYVRQYQAGQNAAGTAPKYPLLARYNVTNHNGSYEATYARYHTDATVNTNTGEIEANGFIKTGGTSSQFLKADGSVDSNTYVASTDLGNYVPKSGSTTMSDDAELVFPSEDWDEQNDTGYATKISHQGVHSYDPDDGFELHMDSTDGGFVNGSYRYPYTSYNNGEISYHPSSSSTYSYLFPSKYGTFAMTSDIPDLNNYVPKSGGWLDDAANLYVGSGLDNHQQAQEGTYTKIASNAIELYDFDDNGQDPWYVKMNSTYPGFVVYEPSNGHTQYSNSLITRTKNNNSYVLELPLKRGTLAVTSDIPDSLSDLSDDSTHRLVTDTEKTTWNNKVSNVQSDWNAASGLAQILNKPTLATVATSGSYNDLSDKPTIPSAVTESTVSGWGFTKNAGTITGITMNGASKGTSGVVDLGTVVTSETDPTVPAWAKAATKPTYTAAEVGALPNTTVIPATTSALTNDSGFKKITISSSEPTSSDGVNGDIWIVI